MMTADKRLRIGFALAIILVLSNLAVPLLGGHWINEAIDRQQSLTAQETQVELLLSALKDGETGQRGFVISGRDDFLAPMIRGYVAADQHIDALRKVLAGDRKLEPSLVRVAAMMERQRRYFGEIIAIRRDQGLARASERISAGEGRQLMDEMRFELAAISSELNARLQVVERDLAWRHSVKDAVLSLTAVLDLLVLVGLFVLTFRFIGQIRDNEARLHGLSDELADGLSKLEQRNRDISLLSLMAEALHSSVRYAECPDVVSRFAGQLFPGADGCLYLYHPSRDVLERATTWGQAGSLPVLIEPEQCWALRRGHVHQVRDFACDLICAHMHEQPTFASGYLCVPLMAQGEPLGVVTLSFQHGHDQALALAFAEQISLGISNLALRESLRQQSIIDPLTGLYNRRFLEENLRRELLRASRQHTSMAVVMLDIDHFKRFNDTFGHEAGDAVLRQVAQEMRRHLRASDLICRFGGEEFCLILPDINQEDAQDRCEALRVAIHRLHVTSRGESLGSVTASFGLAMFPQAGDEADNLLQAADSALYEAKSIGRNCVCCYALNAPAGVS